MQESDYHFQQLPNFLQSELSQHTGPLHGLPLVQVLARQIAAADYWITKKNAGYRHHRDFSDIFGNGPLNKQEMHTLKQLVDGQMGRTPLSPFAEGLLSRLTAESTRCLTQFKNTLLNIQARLQAEEAARQQAQRQAEEIARQQAQRQAEETARQHVAHLRAQQQAAEESARQLARRQAEAEAQRRAEDASLRLIRPRVEQAAITQLLELARKDVHNLQPDADSPLNLIPGPLAFAEGKNAALKLETDIHSALADFANTIDQADGIPTTDAFKAMLHTFRQTGVDLQVISNGLAA